MPVSEVAVLLTAHAKTVSTAESCTGGLLAKQLTDLPGSSAYFLEGVVAYANPAKERLLGVPGSLMEQHGAVSPQVAAAMAIAARAKSGSDYALSTTGIAGPGGATPDKPVGLVYIGVADAGGCQVEELRLDATLSRAQIRENAAAAAFNLLRERLAASGRPGSINKS